MKWNYKDKIEWWIAKNIIQKYQSWRVINKLLKPSKATIRNYTDKYGTKFGDCWFFRNGDYAVHVSMEYNLYFLLKYGAIDLPERGLMRSSDKKWYGYSYRAIRGFKNGDKIEKGSSAYVPSTAREIIDGLDEFHGKDWMRYYSAVIEHKDCLELHERMSQCSLKDKCPNLSKETYDSNHSCEWIEAEPVIRKIMTGRGEHTVLNDSDSYFAAKAFRDGVS